MKLKFSIDYRTAWGKAFMSISHITVWMEQSRDIT